VLQPSVRLEDLIAEQQSRRQELDRHGVYFIGEITDQQAESFSKALLLMSMQREGHPDAGGGSVGAGLAMMQMMDEVRRLYGVKINTVITGYAYSMGAIVFQAGDKRTMGAYSTMMQHSSSWILSGQDEQIFEDYAKLAVVPLHRCLPDARASTRPAGGSATSILGGTDFCPPPNA
jgi:ATP-dependent protease ClpP protease subunit